MTMHTYLECDSCGKDNKTDGGQFVGIAPLVPRESDPTNTEYQRTLHFCTRCFGPFAREANRIAKCFEKHGNALLQGEAEGKDP